ncbi:MAG: helix-turn-helix transcriptional regulator [Peptostreptococcaceae bacterium]|nr:helix-turn-helix transcriptional regulator [Peptostreptococcaceae bacterium]
MRIRNEISKATDENLQFVANISDALAHPARLRMFKYIMQSNQRLEKVYTKTLVEEFGYAQATVSQHMKILVKAHLVETKKEYKYTLYYADLGILMKYLDETKKFLNS